MTYPLSSRATHFEAPTTISSNPKIFSFSCNTSSPQCFLLRPCGQPTSPRAAKNLFSAKGRRRRRTRRSWVQAKKTDASKTATTVSRIRGCKHLVYKTGERWLHFLRGSAASAGKSWMGFILWQTSGLKVKTYLLPRSCGNYKSLYLIGHRLGLLHGQEIYINTCWSKITRHTLTDTQPVCTIPL